MKRLPNPQERAGISRIQELLIDRFVEHQIALNDGQESRAKELERELDNLLQQIPPRAQHGK